MAVCQAGRYRCLAVLVSSYSVRVSNLGIGCNGRGNLQKLLGGAEAPPKVVALIFILSVGFLFLLSAHPRDFVCGTSQSGVKSKRIALVAALQ